MLINGSPNSIHYPCQVVTTKTWQISFTVMVDIVQPSFPAYVCVDENLQLGCTGTPTGGTYSWSKVSGPGNVTFSPNNTTEDPIFTADTPGVYTVKVQYTKDGNIASDTSGDIYVVGVEIDTSASEQIQVQKVNTTSFEWEAILLQLKYNILPSSGWTPDNVTLQILNSSDQVIYSNSTLSKQAGSNQSASWDGKNSSGNLVDYGNYKAKIIIQEAGYEVESNVHEFTVYMVRLGDCVYRPISGNQEHAAVLYSYEGGNTLSDLQNNNNYRVAEILGGETFTDINNYGDYSDWIGAYCPNNFTREKRTAIIAKCKEIDGKDIPYVDPFPEPGFFNALIYKDDNWEGTVNDIQQIRCDGVSEVGYEDANVPLYGGTTWYDIMESGAESGSNLDLHNNGDDSLSPTKQRIGALSRHFPDALYKP